MAEVASSTPADVMAQMNAIRLRLTAQQKAADVPVESGEPTMPYYTFKDKKTQEPVYIAFSEGEPKTQAQLTAALTEYDASGKQPKGYRILEPGKQADVRMWYSDNVAQPLLKAGGAISGNPNAPTTITQSDITSPDAIGPGGAPQMGQGAIGGLYNLVKGMAKPLAESVQTPEQGMATAGGIAAAVGTHGMSTLPQALRIGAGTGLGYLAGDLATGSNQGNMTRSVIQASTVALVASATQGFTGVVKTALGFGVSDNAKQQAASKIADILKTDYRQFMNDPHALEYIGSTPKGVAQLTQVLNKAYMDSANELFDPLSRTVRDTVGYEMKTGAQSTIRAQVRRMSEAADTMISGVGNDKAYQAARRNFNDAVEKIVITATGGAEQADKAQVELAISNIMSETVDGLHKILESSQVASALKVSGAERGLDIKKFQKIMQGISQRQPGSSMEEAGLAAGRGAALTEGTDAGITGQVPVGKLPILRSIPGVRDFSIPVTTGERYVGKVRGTYPVSSAAATNAATIGSIKRYLEEK